MKASVTAPGSLLIASLVDAGADAEAADDQRDPWPVGLARNGSTDHGFRRGHAVAGYFGNRPLRGRLKELLIVRHPLGGSRRLGWADGSGVPGVTISWRVPVLPSMMMTVLVLPAFGAASAADGAAGTGKIERPSAGPS